MWNMKEYYMDLSRTMSEDQMIEFWFELDKQDDTNFITSNDVYEIF